MLTEHDKRFIFQLLVVAIKVEKWFLKGLLICVGEISGTFLLCKYTLVKSLGHFYEANKYLCSTDIKSSQQSLHGSNFVYRIMALLQDMERKWNICKNTQMIIASFMFTSPHLCEKSNGTRLESGPHCKTSQERWPNQMPELVRYSTFIFSKQDLH